jgi:urease accessory protein
MGLTISTGMSTMGTLTAAMAEAPSILPLLAWLSPTYPVGGYAYSHGLEWAAEAGDIWDPPSLQRWLTDILEHGAGRSDAILLAAAHRAAVVADLQALTEANDLALALAPSGELRLETRQQGRSFLEATLAAWPHPRLVAFAPGIDREVAYPIAVGLAAGAHGLTLMTIVEAFLLAFLQNLTSAALRLAPIGQTAGAKVLAALAPRVEALARTIPDTTLEDVGSATFRADLGSFLHETQYTRLFRS